LAAQIVSEIDSFNPITHFKIGFIFLLSLFFIIYFSSFYIDQNKNFFTSYFNYTEGLEIGSDVVLAGIVVGKVTDLKLKNNGVLVYGNINKKYPIPSDSLMVVRSNGIFGKKSLLIEPGFGDIIQDSHHDFTSTKDSYSVDTFLRYLNNLNE
jgi:phospholipid/cholesterol/gamma-HCH transport system substrate-binding protein